MRLGLACLLCAVALVATASGADGPDWKKLDYFHYDLYELALGTNERWTNAGRIPKASEGYVPRYLLPSWARTRGETVDAIWADTCKKGRQSVSFTRSFSAPGDATDVQAFLTYSQGSSSGIRGVRILLNGVLIGRAGPYRSGTNQLGAKTGDPSPLPAAARAFKFGNNVLTIRGTKAANASRCGIGFALLAKFGASVELGESRKSARDAGIPRYAKVDPAATVAFQVTATVRNDGPAASLGGKFIVGIGGDMTIRGFSVVATGKLADCSTTVIDPERLKPVECDFGVWQPGSRETVRVTVSARVTDAVNYGERKVEVGYQIAGFAGVRGAPGGGVYHVTVTRVACGPGSTDPNCKNPKGWGD
ncbi:MAG: hypothetical protein ABR521_07575 [Gaiellaceae bacterium]